MDTLFNSVGGQEGGFWGGGVGPEAQNLHMTVMILFYRLLVWTILSKRARASSVPSRTTPNFIFHHEQSPDKHRQAIAELVSVADSKRTYCAQLSSQLMDNDRKLEMVVKVGGCGEEGGRWHLRGADVGACLSLCFKQGTRP